MLTLKNLVVEIRFNREISLLNSGATNLLIVDHFALFKSKFSRLKQFLQEILLSRQGKYCHGAKNRFRDFDGSLRFEVPGVRKSGF